MPQNRHKPVITGYFIYLKNIELFYTAQPDLSTLSDLQAGPFADTLFTLQNNDLKAAG